MAGLHPAGATSPCPAGPPASSRRLPALPCRCAGDRGQSRNRSRLYDTCCRTRTRQDVQRRADRARNHHPPRSRSSHGREPPVDSTRASDEAGRGPEAADLTGLRLRATDHPPAPGDPALIARDGRVLPVPKTTRHISGGSTRPYPSDRLPLRHPTTGASASGARHARAAFPGSRTDSLRRDALSRTDADANICVDRGLRASWRRAVGAQRTTDAASAARASRGSRSHRLTPRPRSETALPQQRATPGCAPARPAERCAPLPRPGGPRSARPAPPPDRRRSRLPAGPAGARPSPARSPPPARPRSVHRRGMQRAPWQAARERIVRP